MHPLFSKADSLTEHIIAGAIEVHKDKGPGLVEIKAVERVLPVHKAQLLSYMKLLDIPLGLLINFHEVKLTDGVSRLILPRANL